MKIKHRIIGEYATKRCFFLFKKADHRYWKLINYALAWARPNLFLSIFMPVAPDAAACHVCLPRKYGRFMLLIDNNLLLPGANYIYWIISTENDHRHRHKFIKYENPLRKEGNMPQLTYQAKSLPFQREFGRVALPFVRSNDPTDPLHISCICSI